MSGSNGRSFLPGIEKIEVDDNERSPVTNRMCMIEEPGPSELGMQGVQLPLQILTGIEAKPSPSKALDY